MKPIWGILMDAFFVAVLVWCSYTDIKRRTVSNMSVVILLCLGSAHTVLMIMTSSTWWVYPLRMLLGIPFFVAWLRGGMGGGDVKLVMVIGLYLGSIKMLIISILMIFILITFNIILKNNDGMEKIKIPFVSVMALGVFLMMISRMW